MLKTSDCIITGWPYIKGSAMPKLEVDEALN